MTSRKPTVLLTNDDGPPGDHSPFIYPFAKALEKDGFDVRVVIPASQRSWIGKAYMIAEATTGEYFYPAEPDGRQGERSELPKDKSGSEQWILLNSTPATCSNVGLHTLFPAGTFDLVVVGPNFGRNSSSAFALSSGTVGAAMSASLSGVPSIALSFGLMEGYKPPTQSMVDGGIRASIKVIRRLMEKGFSATEEENGVDLYSVNVPLMPEIERDEVEAHWTTMARTNYGRLFKSTGLKAKGGKNEGGPAALAEPTSDSGATVSKTSGPQLHEHHSTEPLKFVFAPDLSALIQPSATEEGTDIHAIHKGCVSITPLRAQFAAAPVPIPGETKWKL